MDEKHQHQTSSDINHCASGFHEGYPKDIKDLIGTLFSLVESKAEAAVLVLAPDNKPGQAYLIKKNFEPGQFESIAIAPEKNPALFKVLGENDKAADSKKAKLMLELFGANGHYPVALSHVLPVAGYTAVVALAGKRTNLVWDSTDQRVLDALGKCISLGRELNKALKEKRLLSHTLESLSEVNRIILENGSFESALARVLSGVNSIVGAEGGGFLFYDEETKSLTLQKPAFGSYDDQLINLYKVTIKDGGNAVRVFQSEEPYLSNNVPDDPRIIQGLARLFNVRNIVSTPVKVSNKCIGVFHVINKPGGFSSEDVGIIRLFVSQLAIAMENAYLFDREKKMARRLQRYIDLNERLMRLVLESAGIQAITNTIARYLTAGVIFCDNRLAKRAWSPQDSSELKAFDPSRLLDMEGRTFQLGSGARLPFKLRYQEDLSREVIAAPVDVGGDTLGYLFVVMESFKQNEDFLSVIQRTLPIYALELLKEQVAREVMQNVEGDFVSALLEGKYVEEQVFRQASGLGYDLSVPRVVVVAELDSDFFREPDIPVSFWRPFLYEINLYLKHHCPKSLAVVLQEQLIILLSYSPSYSGGQYGTRNIVQNLWNELARVTGRKVYIGIGRVARGIEDLESSCKDASFSIKYLKQTKQKEQVVAFRDLGLYQALADESAAGHLYNLMREMLGPLLESDKNKGTSYLKTLDYYFIAGCSIKTAAERLFCHVNTVRYRLERAKKLSRVDIDNVERRFDIQMSLNIAKFYYPEFFMFDDK